MNLLGEDRRRTPHSDIFILLWKEKKAVYWSKWVIYAYKKITVKVTEPFYGAKYLTTYPCPEIFRVARRILQQEDLSDVIYIPFLEQSIEDIQKDVITREVPIVKLEVE